MNGPHRGSHHGFALVELVVATTLLLLALALGTGLLIESLRLIAAAGRALRVGDDDLVLRRLGADLRGLRPVVPATFGWESGPLVLLDEDRAVAWALEGERLVRAEAEPDSGLEAERVLLEQVVAFRWRVEPPVWVEVEIVRRVPDRAPAVRLASEQWKRRGEHLEVVRFGAAARRGQR